MILTILGFYNYDPDIFEDMQLPEDITRETVINSILLECGELELIYPSFNLMKLAIKEWSRREQSTWVKLQDTVTVEYNPLWNVDATIEEVGSLDRDRSGSGSGSGSDTHSVKGYNESNWSNSDKVERSDSNSWSDTDSTEDTRTTTRTGNIGVTSSQQLIQQERDVAAFNVYDYIVDSFKKRFCVLVY